MSQYLGALYPEVASGQIRPEAGELAIAAVQRVLKQYRHAVAPPSVVPMELQ